MVAREPLLLLPPLLLLLAHRGTALDRLMLRRKRSEGKGGGRVEISLPQCLKKEDAEETGLFCVGVPDICSWGQSSAPPPLSSGFAHLSRRSWE